MKSEVDSSKDLMQRRKSTKHSLPVLLGRRSVHQKTLGTNLAAIAFSLSAASQFQSVTRRRHGEHLKSKVAIFARCQDEFTEALAELITVECMEKDHCLLREGEALDALHILVSGTVDLSIGGIRLEEVDEGAVIGEQMVFSGNFCSTFTAKATSRVVTKVLRRSSFVKILAMYHKEREMFVDIGTEYFRNCQNTRPSDIPMLARCDPRFLNYIDLYTARRTFWPSDVLIREGSAGSTCIILHSGEVRVEVGDHHVCDKFSNSIFGELHLLGACSSRCATVRAVKVCHVSVLYRTILMSALNEFPKESEYFAGLVRKHFPEKATSSPLQSIDFFTKCSPELMELLTKRVEERLYMPGHTIVVEGCCNDTIFILTRGTCECVIHDEVIGTLGTGDIFGEMTAIGYTSRACATVRATSICFVQVAYRAHLLAALEQCPNDLRHFISLMQDRRGDLEKHASVDGHEKTDFAESEFFGNCSKSFVATLLERTDVGLFMPGEDMVIEGAVGTTCFILQQGDAEVIKDGQLVAVQRPGAIFGEFTALGLCPRRETTVRAVTVCIIRQLQHDVLWGALDSFPEDLTILRSYVKRKLEPRAAIALQQLPFFAGADLHFVVFIAMQARQQVCLPGHWLVQEQTSNGNNLYVINRGVVQSWKAQLEICLLVGGDYFGATVVLGIHRTYPFSYSAKSMSHIISFGRDLLLAGVQRYQHVRKWLETCCRHEKIEHEASLSVLRERVQVGKTNKHLWKNIGRLFPNMHCLGSTDSEEALSRVYFNSWLAVCSKQRKLRMVWQAMHKAAGGRHRPPPISLSPRPTSPSLCRNSRGSPRPSPFQRDALSKVQANKSSWSFAMDTRSSKLSEKAADQKGVDDSIEQQKLNSTPISREIPAPPVKEDDSWGRKLQALMKCSTGRDLYHTAI